MRAFRETRNERELLIAMQAAAAWAERVNVRAPRRGEIVTLADTARGLKFEFKAKRLTSSTSPVRDYALLVVQRLG